MTLLTNVAGGCHNSNSNNRCISRSECSASGECRLVDKAKPHVEVAEGVSNENCQYSCIPLACMGAVLPKDGINCFHMLGSNMCQIYRQRYRDRASFDKICGLCCEYKKGPEGYDRIKISKVGNDALDDGGGENWNEIGSAGLGRGVAVEDLTGDGIDDIVIASGEAQPHALRAWSSAAKQEVTIDSVKPKHLMCNWAVLILDYDNDGVKDLMLVNGGALPSNLLNAQDVCAPDTLHLYRGIENMRYAYVGLMGEASYWWGASQADLDNDGCLDLVATRGSLDGLQSRAVLFRNKLCDDGDGTAQFPFVSVRDAFYVKKRPMKFSAHNPVIFDKNNDGCLDIFISGSHSIEFLSQGCSGKSLRFSSQEKVTEYVFAAAAGDFNMDGVQELYIGVDNGADFIAWGNGTRMVLSDRKICRKTPQGTIRGLDGSVNDPECENTMGLGIGDFSMDGFPDVVVGGGDPFFTKSSTMYCNSGKRDGVWLGLRRCFKSKLGRKRGRTHGIAFGDYDGDGQLDIAMNRGGMPSKQLSDGDNIAQTLLIFPGSVWHERKPLKKDAIEFRFRLVGAARPDGTCDRNMKACSNRDAIGAKVIFEDPGDGEVRYLHMNGMSGFQSQNSGAMFAQVSPLKAHMRVVWPSKLECKVTLQPSHQGQAISINENSGTCAAITRTYHQRSRGTFAMYVRSEYPFVIILLFMAFFAASRNARRKTKRALRFCT